VQTAGLDRVTQRNQGRIVRLQYFPNQALHTVRTSLGNASEADMVDRLSGREMMVLQQLAGAKPTRKLPMACF